MLVFQVIVPVLFVYFFDRAAEAWYTDSLKRRQLRRGARRSSSVGSDTASDTASGGAPSSPPASSAAAGSPQEGAWAAEPAGGQYELEQQQQLLHGHHKPANAQPSAALVMLFGLGLAGVLFDVVLTVHTRLAPAELS